METVVKFTSTAFRDKPSRSRNASIYLCRKHTGEKLNAIGRQFGISDSAVSQVCKRFKTKMDGDKELKKQIESIEKKIRLSKVET
jgi:chromosomal replication initiation ATPase DnaA